MIHRNYAPGYFIIFKYFQSSVTDDGFFMTITIIIAATCDFQQCGILTSVDSDGAQSICALFAISDDIFCAHFAISFAHFSHPNQGQLVISGRETMTCTGHNHTG